MDKHDENMAELAARIATKATVQLCCDRFYDELVKIFTYSINPDVFFAAEDAKHIKDLVYNLAEKYGDTIREHGGLPPVEKWRTDNPPTGGWYLATWRRNGELQVSELSWHLDTWRHWSLAGETVNEGVIAWMELPEPYKAENEFTEIL